LEKCSISQNNYKIKSATQFYFILLLLLFFF
jgi:hypothetical protein